MVWWTAFTLGTASLIPTLWVQFANAGNTTCASSQLDWYTSVVGESPCVTYQRLRQICNNDYQVPTFRTNTPGDQCDDQVASCCCNTVAFQLSMLCMNCQYDTQPGDQIGIDAGVGAYTLYRQTCGAGTNHSLPDDIQSAVCNLNIRLDNYLYGGWDDGSCVWTKENADRDHAANNNNTFTHCANQISPSSTPTSTSSSSSSAAPATTTISSQSTSTSSSGAPAQTGADNNASGSHSSHNNIGPIVGGVLGGIGAVAAVVGAIVFWRIRRDPSGATPATPDPHYSYGYQDNPPMGSATPFAASIGAMSPGSEAFASGGTVVGEPYPGFGAGSAIWSQVSHSIIPPSTLSPDESLRHDDAGPIAELSRSPSGRLPPAYRSWEQATGTGSNSGSASVAGTGSAGGSAYSETQPFGVLSPTGSSSVASPSPQELDPHMPLVPLRRSSIAKE
ncbi:hypothetical protein BD311DRAFT_113728 [Dichomitus squalens]|uniref:Mid2 domain-containing protein n=1 Tax=Dichomitus squalens TaxID=114155 RepID=A0A4Q9MAV1_9APHY|nr:hypothetical protein BD311DRAFT_113728 [Dichomitus squalens]